MFNIVGRKCELCEGEMTLTNSRIAAYDRNIRRDTWRCKCGALINDEVEVEFPGDDEPLVEGGQGRTRHENADSGDIYGVCIAGGIIFVMFVVVKALIIVPGFMYLAAFMVLICCCVLCVFGYSKTCNGDRILYRNMAILSGVAAFIQMLFWVMD